MQGKSVVLLLLLTISFVFAQNYPRIGTFEGNYDSEGEKLYFCINGNILQGSIGESAILNGVVSSDGQSANGTIYIAGLSNCDQGMFFINRTAEGFSGYHTCNRLPGVKAPLSGRKLSAFRPTDAQCALVYPTPDLTLEGRWVDQNGQTYDICFKSSSSGDNYTAHISYTTSNSGSYYYPNQGFMAAYHELSGRVVKGTWYEDYNAGAMLMYLNNNGEIILWKWTGLLGHQGATYFDYKQKNLPDMHEVLTLTGPSLTTNAQCDRNKKLDNFVLENLQNVFSNQNGEFYYFLNTYISNPVYRADVPVDSARVIVPGIVLFLIVLFF